MLSIDLAAYLPEIWNTASQIINGLFGVYTVPVGLTLGMGVLLMIVNAFKGAIKF